MYVSCVGSLFSGQKLVFFFVKKRLQASRFGIQVQIVVLSCFFES